MRKLQIYIEIEGKQTYVGLITGDSPQDARFAYSDSYIAAGYPPISISLPISRNPFSAEATKNFFEGLLPEGFARKTVANWIHAAEDDYLEQSVLVHFAFRMVRMIQGIINCFLLTM